MARTELPEDEYLASESYELDGAPAISQDQLGFYSEARESFLKDRRKTTYSILLVTGQLLPHLADVQKQCMEAEEMLMKKLMEKEGATEELKTNDWMAYIGLVNNIQNRVQEIVLHRMVYI